MSAAAKVKLVVRDATTGEAVHTVFTDAAKADKVERGMVRQMDTDRFVLDVVEACPNCSCWADVACSCASGCRHHGCGCEA